MVRACFKSLFIYRSLGACNNDLKHRTAIAAIKRFANLSRWLVLRSVSYNVQFNSPARHAQLMYRSPFSLLFVRERFERSRPSSFPSYSIYLCLFVFLFLTNDWIKYASMTSHLKGRHVYYRKISSLNVKM